VVYGCSEPKSGFSRELKNLGIKQTEVVNGVLEEEARTLMQDFFRSRRS
jgi:tRNA(Arg) A34 adenosine deaminase TadA